MSPGGGDFLVANLDPFHDNQLKDLAGWPDEETAPSVIRIIKQSVTLQAPASAGTGNWDTMITAWPFLDLVNMALASRTVGNNIIETLTGASPLAPMGGVTCHSKSSSPVPFNLSTDFNNQVVMDSAYSKGVGRLIGYAFEVVNTTADLYRQGLVTVYRQSQPLGEFGTLTQRVLTDTAVTYFQGVSYRQPPLTVADALLYPGSRQWRAEEGCYVVAPFCGGDNKPTTVQYAQPVVTISDDVTFSNNTSNIWVPLYTTTGAPPNVTASYRGVKHNPYHSVGAIFSGLSNSTTLQVNVNMIYETFPNVSERDILVLAKPSCSYDPVALTALSHVLSSLPVGVPASMNAGGDWFYDLVETIAEYAPKIGEFIPGVGPIIGKGIGAAADLGLTYMTPPGDTTVSSKNSQAAEVRMKKRNDARTLQAKKAENKDKAKNKQVMGQKRKQKAKSKAQAKGAQQRR